MATSNWDKFVLLLWKNWLIQSRHIIQTVFEILLPVLFASILILLRGLVNPEFIQEPSFYSPLNLNSLAEFNNKTIMKLQNIRMTVSYSPEHPLLTDLLENAVQKLESIRPLNVSAFKDSEELYKNLVTSNIFVGVEFPPHYANLTDLPKHFEFTLRFPSELRTSSGFVEFANWFTTQQFPEFQYSGPRNKKSDSGGIPPGYYQEGFLPVQYAISKSYTEMMGAVQDPEEVPEVFLQRFPYVPFLDDPLLVGLEGFVSFIIVIAYLYSSINIVKYVTIEKEKQLKEAMKIMGLSNWLHWTAWFIKCFILYLITSALITLIFKVQFKADSDVAVYTETDWGVLLFYLLIYSVSSICFCFMISTFFSKANTASMLAGVLWFVAYAPFGVTGLSYDTLSESTKWILCLTSNSAMSFGMKLIMRHESEGYGLQWSNLFEPTNQDDVFTVGDTMIMLLVDAALYMTIALYVEKVFPGEFGVPEKWYFPVSPSFWCKKVEALTVEEKASGSINFEPDPVGKNAGIQIKNLRKVFDKKVAVKGLTLNMYEDQITVLLGHNGAGKTTTMSMLTGMIPPTSGTALIDGKDIRSNIEGVRDSLGLCPQHNVLFDELTVAEHIRFFARLKGLKGKAVDAEIRKYTQLLELEDKTNAQSKTLSGGMKRKLSVGIALSGGSRVVLLDEPTSGMDPSARRALWDLLAREKKDRTLLLSTHFMDEADVLGDRIAIMAEGDLKCVGSPFFLKKRYGVGYRLVCVKRPDCRPQDLTALLAAHIPDIRVETDIGSELSYVLSDSYSSRFRTILEDVERHSDRCGIASYGVSLTTMEEVFLKVGSDSTAFDDEQDQTFQTNGLHEKAVVDSNGQENGFPIDRMENGEERLLEGFALIYNQSIAMVLKKLFYTYRNWRTFLLINAIPIVFLLLTILTVRGGMNDVEPEPLTFSIDMFRLSTTLFEKDNFPAGSRESQVVRQFESIYSWNENHEFRPTDRGMQEQVIHEYSENEPRVNREFMIGASVTSRNITAWFNNQAYHTAPLTVLTMQNAILKTFCDDCEISVTNYPLDTSIESQFQFLQQGNNMGFQLAVNTASAFSFFSAFFVLFYIKERVSRSKLLQFVSGVNVKIYWLISFLWDYAAFIFGIVLYVAFLAIFQEDGFSSFVELARVTEILLVFAWAALPMVYLASFLFTVPSTGYVRLSILFVLMGVVLFMIVFILGADVFELQDVADALDWVFIFIPHYSVSRSLSTINVITQTRLICDASCNILVGCRPETVCLFVPQCCDIPEIMSFGKGGIGKNIVAMASVGFVFFVVLFLVEYRVLNFLMYKRKPPTNIPETEDEEMDSDVRAEKDRIQSMSQMEISHNNLVLRDVTKFYKNFMAVNQLCVGVNQGECFGLLGVNGAGKTSTFKMLTGDEDISAGDAWVQGISLRTSMSRVNQMIGYCPQFDALLDEITGREHLKIYCLLRGVPRHRVAAISQAMAEELNFTKHLDKVTKAYSGGNKRKLSTAIALLGNPACVYLDEPTSGMDPGAKRQLWDVICKVRKQGKSIVLTSHSMEECEALCTRLAIMVNGEFKCLGSTQHLKNKFSEGFMLAIKLAREDRGQGVAKVKDFVNKHFFGAVLKEEHSDLLSYHIKQTNLLWSEMFGLMEDNKEALKIEDYSLGQTSLEQVFLFFTKYQRDDALQN